MQTLSFNICFNSDFKGVEVRGHSDRALGGLSLRAPHRYSVPVIFPCLFFLFFFVPNNDPSVLRVMSICMIVFSQSDGHFTSGTLSSMVGHMIKHMTTHDKNPSVTHSLISNKQMSPFISHLVSLAKHIDKNMETFIIT